MNPISSVGFVVIAIASLLHGCKTPEGQSTISATKKNASAHQKEIYYNFDGPVLVDLKEVSDCGGSDIPELRACQVVNGKFYINPKCDSFCSIPIAKPGFVAGYDFSGFRSAKAAQKGRTCPVGGINPLPGICQGKGGEVAFDINCNALCSKPVASK